MEFHFGLERLLNARDVIKIRRKFFFSFLCNAIKYANLYIFFFEKREKDISFLSLYIIIRRDDMPKVD